MGFLLLLILLIATLATVAWKAFSGRSLSTLWILETAIRNNLPLDEVLEGHAYEFGGKRGRRLLALSRVLRSGEDLAQALDKRPYRNLVPEEGRLAVMVGSESGTLSPAVRDALELATLRFDRARQQHSFSALYLASVISIIVLQLTFLMVFIMPKYKEIFLDFNSRLPESTEGLIHFTNYFAIWSPVWEGIGLVITCDAIRRYFERRRHGRAMYGFFHLINPRLFTVDLLRLLGVSATAGRPLSAAIDGLARHHNDPVIRRKLARVSREAQQGQNLWDSLHQVRLIDTWQTGVLKAAEPTPLLGDSLQRLARELDLDQYHRRQMRREALRPLVMLILGAFVLFVAISFFAPLVDLMGDLA
ncbi:MAG: hypothetical protein GC152_03635 [Alphaproteobacteria bacterium]|nr:hypothetical protein [Alphaproteobacteria bacterium]